MKPSWIQYLPVNRKKLISRYFRWRMKQLRKSCYPPCRYVVKDLLVSLIFAGIVLIKLGLKDMVLVWSVPCFLVPLSGIYLHLHATFLVDLGKVVYLPLDVCFLLEMSRFLKSEEADQLDCSATRFNRWRSKRSWPLLQHIPRVFTVRILLVRFITMSSIETWYYLLL